MKKDLTILMPCLNEERALGWVVSRAKEMLKRNKIRGEVLVVDNGSSDGSVGVAKKNGARVEVCYERGYGSALMFGIKKAKGKYVVMLDSDGSYDPLQAERLWNKMKVDGDDFVMGSRMLGSIEDGAMPALHRYVGTPVLTMVINRFFDVNISDCHSGMMMFDREKALKLGLRGKNMDFGPEIIIKAKIKGLKIGEVPIDLHRDKRGGRRSHLKTWRDGWKNLRMMLKFAPHYFFVLPGLALLWAGSFFVLTQIFGPINLGWIRFDVHYMVFGMLFGFMGMQLVQMGVALEKDLRLSGYEIGWLYPKIENKFNLENGIVFGGGLMGAGALLGLYVFWTWFASGFGQLYELRRAIVAVYLAYLGVQIIFFSFFLSFVGKK